MAQDVLSRPTHDLPRRALFDIGGTTLRTAYMHGDELEIFPSQPTPNIQQHRNASMAALERDLVDAIMSSLHDNGSLAKEAGFPMTIGVSFAGLVRGNRKVVTAPDILGSTSLSFDIATRIERALGGDSRCVVVNDLVAAAWRYIDTMSRKDVRRYALLTVSTGIGYFVLDLDAPESCGEDPVSLGHHPAREEEDVVTCTCGEKGHITAGSSGIGIQNRVARWALESPHEFRCSLLYRLAARRLARASASDLEGRFGQRFHRLNAFQLLPMEVVSAIEQDVSLIADDDVKRYVYPLVLETRDFVTAVMNKDSAALRLLRSAAEPVALHLARQLLDDADQIVIMGGLAHALGNHYVHALVSCMPAAKAAETAIKLSTGYNDDLDGVIGVSNYMDWLHNTGRVSA